MMQFENIVFWSYVVLLLIGGLIGFFSAGSKVSLMTSAVAAALLILTRLPGIFQPSFGRTLADVIMALLSLSLPGGSPKTKNSFPADS